MFRRNLFQAFGQDEENYECNDTQAKWTFCYIISGQQKTWLTCAGLWYGIDRKTWFGVTHELCYAAFLQIAAQFFLAMTVPFPIYTLLCSNQMNKREYI